MLSWSGESLFFRYPSPYTLQLQNSKSDMGHRNAILRISTPKKTLSLAFKTGIHTAGMETNTHNPGSYCPVFLCMIIFIVFELIWRK